MSTKLSVTIRSLVVTLSLLVAMVSGASQEFPTAPDPSLTPGSLCDQPDSVRYPERIKYCSRDVDTELKREIIQDYNEKLGYGIRHHQRSQFKIDHYIPLCMGGSNHKDNLWPQHQTVYKHTDHLEMTACEKMADGRLSQRLAVEYIRKAKADYRKAREIIREIEGL